MSNTSFDYIDFSITNEYRYSMTPEGSSSQESLFFSSDSSPVSSPESIHIKGDPDALTPMYEPQGREPKTPYLKDMLPAFRSFFGMEQLKNEPDTLNRRISQDVKNKAEEASSIMAPVWTPPALNSAIFGRTKTTTASETSATRKRKRITSDDSTSTSEHEQKDVLYCVDRSRQRIAANMKERRRTRALNDAFVTLRKSVPMPDGDKASKFHTLRMAANYIEFLHEVYAAMATDQTQDFSKKMKSGVKMAMYAIQESSRCSRSVSVEELKYAFHLWLMEIKAEEERAASLKIRPTRLLGERPEGSDQQSSHQQEFPSSLKTNQTDHCRRSQHATHPAKIARVIPERLLVLGNENEEDF